MKQRNQFGNFDIHSRLAKEGWSLQGTYYNAHKSCTFICPNAHKRVLPWMSLRLSFFCRACQDIVLGKEIEKILQNTVWHVLDVKDGKCRIQCDSGHIYHPCRKSDIAKKLDREPSCSVCKKIARALNVKSLFEELGWTLLESYRGVHCPVFCLCPDGHKQMKRPSDLLHRGSGCERCSGLTKKTDQEVQKEFSDLGWKVVGKYIGTSVPIDCICPKGHLIKKSLDCLRISPLGCPVCSGQIPIHPIEKRKRRNERVKNFRIWRPMVLERDGYRCVICGSVDNVQAHHLNSYHYSKKERYDVGNGISLCLNHHGSPFARIRGSFHSVYGFMNNTREQFEEYRRQMTKGKVRV